jgi:hypothetical protein
MVRLDDAAALRTQGAVTGIYIGYAIGTAVVPVATAVNTGIARAALRVTGVRNIRECKICGDHGDGEDDPMAARHIIPPVQLESSLQHV